MTNIIMQTMPERVNIDGKSYRINSDFRIWLKAIQILDKYPPSVCAALLAPICYKDIPQDASHALKGIAAFLNPDRSGGKKEKRVIDFEADSSYIFSAFYAQYGIDLSIEKMHYYKFCALLRGLCGEHILLRIINIRSIDLSEIKDAELRKKYAVLKNMCRIGGGNAEPGECIFNIMKEGDTLGEKENRHI